MRPHVYALNTDTNRKTHNKAILGIHAHKITIAPICGFDT